MTLVLKKMISRFRNTRKSRKVSLVLLISILSITQILSLLSLLSLLNFSQLLSNIKIPSGFIYIEMDIYSPETMTIQIPYEIKNPGLFELNNIELSVELRLNYINKSDHANKTTFVFSRESVIGCCLAFNSLIGSFNGEFSDFCISSLIEFYNEYNEFEPVNYLLDIDFSAKYFFELIYFRFAESNLNLLNF